ncbi:hypothetical protein V8E53_001282 [Lactarius tabidus]
MDPNVVRERLALQMQIYAFNNGAMVSDSTHTPSSTPFPGLQHNLWTLLQTRNAFGEESTTSMRSSPSRQPVSLPPLSRGNHRPRRREHSEDLRRRAKSADEAHVDDGEWIDQGVGGMEGVADDLLQLESHTDYVGNPEKPLLRAFHALDRETDTILVLLAAPSHTARGKLHPVATRAAGRDTAHHRRASRSSSLLEQLSRVSSSSRDGSSSSSSDAREDDLRRTLETAIGSLHALGGLYEQREMRWVEEKRRLDEDTKENMTVRECNSYEVTKDPAAVSYDLEVSVRGDCDTCT